MFYAPDELHRSEDQPVRTESKGEMEQRPCVVRHQIQRAAAGLLALVGTLWWDSQRGSRSGRWLDLQSDYDSHGCSPCRVNVHGHVYGDVLNCRLNFDVLGLRHFVNSGWPVAELLGFSRHPGRCEHRGLPDKEVQPTEHPCDRLNSDHGPLRPFCDVRHEGQTGEHGRKPVGDEQLL